MGLRRLDLVSPHTSGMAKILRRTDKKAASTSKKWITYTLVQPPGESDPYWVKSTHFKDSIYIRKGKKVIAYTHEYANGEIVEGEGA